MTRRMILGSEWDDVRRLLSELRKVTFAHIRRKKVPWSIFEQLNHMHSEVSEVWRIINSCEGNIDRLFFAKKRILDEISDCVYSAITAAHLLDYSDQDILEGLVKCLHKIQEREE